jgi:cytoskeletal protein CcmA (bactofilin family)
MDIRSAQGGQMEEPRTIFAEDVEITGSIKCTGAVRLGGKLSGDLVCGSDVAIEKSAVVKGNLTVNSVVVLGQVRGNITAKDRIELKGNARIVGDIKGKRLVVEDGVSLVGKSEINPPSAAPGEMTLDAEPEPKAAEEAAEELMKLDEEDASKSTAHRASPRDDGRGRASQLFARK